MCVLGIKKRSFDTVTLVFMISSCDSNYYIIIKVINNSLWLAYNLN